MECATQSEFFTNFINYMSIAFTMTIKSFDDDQKLRAQAFLTTSHAIRACENSVSCQAFYVFRVHSSQILRCLHLSVQKEESMPLQYRIS